jgi:hypothetical protein
LFLGVEEVQTGLTLFLVGDVETEGGIALEIVAEACLTGDGEPSLGELFGDGRQLHISQAQVVGALLGEDDGVAWSRFDVELEPGGKETQVFGLHGRGLGFVIDGNGGDGGDEQCRDEEIGPAPLADTGRIKTAAHRLGGPCRRAESRGRFVDGDGFRMRTASPPGSRSGVVRRDGRGGARLVAGVDRNVVRWNGH